MPGQRYSRQRELIYEAVRATDQHPTAEMVFRRLRPQNPRLSLGTVYRNLNLLADEGLLTRIPLPVERYDACTWPHSHLRCESCGGFFDLPVEYDAEMDTLAAKMAPDVTIRRHDLIFYGLCPKCREEK